jgi:hypothetical protein
MLLSELRMEQHFIDCKDAMIGGHCVAGTNVRGCDGRLLGVGPVGQALYGKSSCCEQGGATWNTRTGAFGNSVEGDVIFQGYAIDFIHGLGRARVA